MKYLKDKKLIIVISVLISFVQVIITLYQPQLISKVIENLNIIDASGNVIINKEGINHYATLVIIVGFIGLVLGIVNTICSSNLAMYVSTKLREEVFLKVQQFSYEQIEKFSVPHLIVRLTNDINQIQNIVMAIFQMLIRMPLMFVGAVYFTIISTPSLWWTTILYIIIIVIIMAIMMRIILPKFKIISKSNDKITTIIKENVDGARVVKSFVQEEKEMERFEKEVKIFTKNFKQTGYAFGVMIPLFTLVANLIIVLVIYLMADIGVKNPEMIANIVSFSQYIMLLMFTVVSGGFMLNQFGRAMVSNKRINEVLEVIPDKRMGTKKLEEFESLKFENVSFKYDMAEDYSLKNLNFVINKGEKVGIIGMSGSGKSTLVQMIPGLLRPTEGQILINGYDEKEYDEKSLLNKIAIVLQKANLFSGTIKDNLLHGNENGNDNQIEQASKLAQAYEFIDKKEKRFDEQVYQKGANFSGGQKQRLSIARALMKNPELLIFDDSTSALDAKSEGLIKNVIYNDLKEKTCIIVAQKISSIVECNKIIVLKNGMIENIGTHQELLEKSSLYQEIYDTQKE